MTNKLSAILIYFVLFCLATANGQEGNNWYFGRHAGLNFNSPTPTIMHDGALSTFEGCASISDKTGKLLFYTDGITVWDRNHQPMPNGSDLHGDSSSANAAIIIAKPGSETIYYIFTSDAFENENRKGYNYSEVDITLNNGLGDITSNKNILLYAPSTEKLTAVRHANGLDIWVITHAWGNNQWKNYLITCNGVNTTPVISSSGSSYTETREVQLDGPAPVTWNIGSAGCLKASPDGKKIATTVNSSLIWELFDFDNTTGIIYNNLSFHEFEPYGIEFSPNSRLLYVSCIKMGYDSSYLKQFDITSNSAVAIKASEIVVGKTKKGYGPYESVIFALQLGPDNKIYCAVRESNYLSVVNSPNTPGVNCNYLNEQINLGDKTCMLGLPVFFTNLLTSKNVDFGFTASNDCATVTFNPSSSITNIARWDWDFGDGINGSGKDISHLYSPSAIQNEFVATLTVSVATTCGTVEAKASKKISLKRTTPITNFKYAEECGNLSIQFEDSSEIEPGNNVVKWHWDFGDGLFSDLPSPSHTYSDFGEYDISLTTTSDGVCNGSQTISKTVNVNAKPIADLTVSNSCVNQPISFTDNSLIAYGSLKERLFIFDDGTQYAESSFKKTFTSPGTNIVKLVVSSIFCVSDTISKNFVVESKPLADFKASNLCIDSVIQFTQQSYSPNGSLEHYYWDMGDSQQYDEQNPSHRYALPGTYTVRFWTTSFQQCSSDTIQKMVQIDSKPNADFIVAGGCEGLPLSIENSSFNKEGTIVKYEWDIGDGFRNAGPSPSILMNQGQHSIQLRVSSQNGCISNIARKNFIVHSNPNVDFEFESSCVGKPIDFINRSTNQLGDIIKWSWTLSSETKASTQDFQYTFREFGNYRVVLQAFTDNGCTASKERSVLIKKVNIFAGRDTIVSIGQPLQLDASGGITYQWTPQNYLSNANIVNPIAMLPGDFTYELTGVTREGCVGHDAINVKVYRGPEVFVPTAFTPDGNNLNDILVPVLPGIKTLINFTIYNRWGQIVFSTAKIGQGWDGTQNGKFQQSGTFVWKLQAIDFLDNPVNKTGTTTMLR